MQRWISPYNEQPGATFEVNCALYIRERGTTFPVKISQSLVCHYDTQPLLKISEFAETSRAGKRECCCEYGCFLGT